MMSVEYTFAGLEKSNKFLGYPSLADFDEDGDVDGSDLIDMVLGNAALDLAAFAPDFGREN